MTCPPAEVSELLAFDRQHVWHPYDSMTAPGQKLLVESAAGVHLQLRLPDGGRRQVIDGMSSWWAAIHGYRVPELDAAAHQQLEAMSHVMFGGLAHQAAIGLVRRLIDLAPTGLDQVFLADSGSVAVEVAMKMALQNARAQGRRADRFFTIRGGYHGDTMGPMSVTDPINGMHKLFAGVLPQQIFAPRPPGGLNRAADDPELVAWATATRKLFTEHAEQIAAVIVEPILQGAGGMHLYSPVVLWLLHELAATTGALTIHDEIATGFWRTGTRWAAQRAQVVPDIMVVGKALTGGYLTLGATLTTRAVATAVSSELGGGALMHGPTFMGNPLACAIANASLDLLAGSDQGATTQARVAALEADLTAGLTPLQEVPGVAQVRTCGAVGVVQLVQPVPVSAASAAALEQGVWIRPFRDLIYVMPPYRCGADETATICRGVQAAVQAAVATDSRE